MGADDYVPKPCTPRELLARINAILRHAQQSGEPNNAPNSISVSDVVLYPAKRQATIKDTPLELTSTEFNLLEVLMRHGGCSKRAHIKVENYRLGLFELGFKGSDNNIAVTKIK